ncbi:MAG: hypothetical protein J0M12_02380 [Deltaproteobacteria bacterium]|nr:hypothetical protein [Deltaproteobacteria bacterium]
MRIQAQCRLTLIIFILLCCVGCHATRTPPHHGCFNPVPTPPGSQLQQPWVYQLRWPLARNTGSLQAISSFARRGLPLLEVEAGTRSFYPSAIRAVRGFPTALVLRFADESPQVVARAIELAESTNVGNQIVVQTQSLATARFVRHFYPEIAILIRCDSPAQAQEALTVQPSPNVIFLDFPWDSEGLIQQIHEAGAAVAMSAASESQDNPQRWNQLMDLGVDIVYTNQPENFTRSIPRACAAK